jgi:hypothetical protein
LLIATSPPDRGGWVYRRAASRDVVDRVSGEVGVANSDPRINIIDGQLRSNVCRGADIIESGGSGDGLNQCRPKDR